MKKSKIPVCAVLTCKLSAEDSNGPRKDLSFHRFPKNEDLKKRWVEMSGRENWVPNDTSSICSRHFRDTDYIVKRSGNRHLKVTAIPCEYVVYSHLFPDEETPAAGTNEDREATPASSPTPTVSTYTPIPEADTTSIYDEFNVNDLNDNTVGWDQFQTMRHFGQREPEPTMKRRSSTARPVKRKRSKKSKAKKHRNRQPRDLSSSMETFQPQMEEIFASTDEIQPPIEEAQPPLEEVDLSFEEIEPPMEEIDYPVEEVRPPTPEVRPPNDIREHLNQIKVLIASRKESGRAATAGMAEVREAKQIKMQIQEGDLNGMQKAEAIMRLQNKQIIKLTVKYRRLKKIIKQIAAILQNELNSLIRNKEKGL